MHMISIDHKKLLFVKPLKNCLRNENFSKLFDSDSFLYLPLFRRCKLPTIVIFENYRKLLLLYIQLFENNEGIQSFAYGGNILYKKNPDSKIIVFLAQKTIFSIAENKSIFRATLYQTVFVGVVTISRLNRFYNKKIEKIKLRFYVFFYRCFQPFRLYTLVFTASKLRIISEKRL